MRVIQGTYVNRCSLHTNVALLHDSLDTIIQKELDTTFQHHSKIHTLCTVHNIHIIWGIACDWEIHKPAEHA